jgi:flagellar hook-associated protein 1 FlgK
MSLFGTLNVSKSALAVTQVAIQTTGNNIANAGNADYTRQVARQDAARDRQLRPGVFIGTGVNLTSIQRQIDEALEARIRASIADDEAASVAEQWIGRIEAVFNELTDQDLSSQLSAFFNSWSNLANQPQDVGLRQVVLQSGQSVAGWFQSVRTQLGQLRNDVADRLTALAGDVDTLATRIADLNGQVVKAEAGGTGQANGLRDQRDALLKQLSSMVDIRTSERDAGVIDVFVGSEPLVVGTTSRGATLRQEAVDGTVTAIPIFRSTGGSMRLDGKGQLGALDQVRQQIDETIDTVDRLAGSLIFELNKLHASGQGTEGFASVSATRIVADPTVALNAPETDLPFKPVNGSFVVHVRDKTTGLLSSTLIEVDLDGLDGDDTTLNSLAAALDAIDDVSANASGGRLNLSADSDAVEIRFSQDSSGVLAALGINGFFDGKDARDIAVNATLRARPQLIAAARNGQPGDNQTARAIAAMETQALGSLSGQTLKSGYQSMINTLASKAATAKGESASSRAVRETLQAQREALSGVSLDEEAINLMKYQRAYQGAARVVAAIDELMQTLLSLV